MAATKIDGIEEETNQLAKMEEGRLTETNGHAPSCLSHSFMIAELIGTYFIIFAGCGAVAVDKIYGKVTFPGVCVTWGLIVMVMIYSLAHISGAHFNPAVTIALAIFRQFKRRQVPLYIVAQVVGSLLASGTLSLMLDVTPQAYFGTVPVGSNAQSFVAEIIISFLLMFVISGAVTDDRAIGQFGGVAVGMTIMLNVFVAGPISGASMNPARSIGPAIVKHKFRGIWLYIIGPVIGTVTGGFAYNLIKIHRQANQLHINSSVV
ncbi:putative aquaporin NIP4-1 [Citrus sinensis]|uniref:Putative aquaporin NIP12 n=1 Tax=Citrus sinensis TaxID=2711 RepID=A0A4Y5QLY9_CITSI|nr:putative aquaporin NIP4-1 [Citrus sinensis]QCX35439.1 putative aquaporin NIP1;2 [Citrus sinensis]